MSSTTIIFEQPSSFFIQVSSSVPIYGHLLVGISVGLFLWFAITLATAKPPVLVREISPTRPKHSLRTASSTLVDHSNETTNNLQKEKALLTQDQYDSEETGDYITFTNPFAHVNAPVRISRKPSLALHPFARRMSMPGRQPTNFTPHPFTPAHTPFAHTPLRQHAIVLRHGSLADDGVSYFPTHHEPSGKMRVIEDEVKEEEEETVVECEEADKVDSDVQSVQPALESWVASAASTAPSTSKKGMKFKRATKKVAALFHHSSRRS
ncbi:hypothetical protein DXG01_000292 [Tephrocybe rancida]|nr:hypothetical protein DXG01_000292 [Tephrocybe rancida]